MPDPEPAISRRIEELVDAAGDRFDAGDGPAGHRLLDEAWTLLPEPKPQWDFYSQVLPTTAARRCRDAGLYDEAFGWLARAREAYAPTAGWLLDGYEATVRYEAETPDAAEYAARTLAEWGTRAFKAEDPKYLRFARSGRRSEGVRPASGTRGPAELDSDRIDELSEAGSDLLDDDWEAALALFQEALALVPEPQSAYGEAMWLLTSIGDAYHSGQRWADAETHLTAALACPDGTGNAYLWLRLGQSQRELGRPDDAANSLLSAFMLEGDTVFADEPPKYLRLLADRGLI